MPGRWLGGHEGYNFASTSKGLSVDSSIRKLVSNWKVEHGQAQAQDVAMVTDENRIALQGRLNFVNETFDDVIVALIDARPPRSSKRCMAPSINRWWRSRIHSSPSAGRH